MPHIILDDEQAKILAGARDAVELRDRRGRSLGVVTPSAAAETGFTEEEIAEALRRSRSNEPRYTTQQVLDHLASLEREQAGRR
ncbi:MAG TPA: hypothetical protein VF170_13645 [Planctomycetaceae bacterium]